MARRSSTDRFREMLAILPLLRRGETLSVDELAKRIGATPRDIVDDVYTLFMVGAPPYSPDMMIEVDFSEDETTFTVTNEPPALDRTVRFTVPETTALLAALQACGVEPDDPLAGKLSQAAGSDVDPDELTHVVRAAISPGDAGAVYAAIARAVVNCEAVEIEYFSAGRGETTVRVIHPYVLELHRGQWYLSAYCELVEGDRVFRLDRVGWVTPTGRRFEPPAQPPPPTPDLTGRTDLSTAEVVFAPGAALPSAREWPGIELEARDDGSTLARVPFDGVDWLARRIVARLGDAQVTAPAELRAAVAGLAGRIARDYADAS